MPLGVLEARMWSVSVVVGVGVPLRARTVLELAHLDGRVGWCARELRALISKVLLRAASFGCRMQRDPMMRLWLSACSSKHVCRALLRLYAWSCHSKPV